jgi:hypothetical protein
MQHVPKRSHDDIVSNTSSNRPRSSKVQRRASNDVSPTRLHRALIGLPTIDTKSTVSEGYDKLGWNPHAAQMSDETLNKLKDIVTEEVNARLLKALEHGALKIQPSRFSPTDVSVRTRLNGVADEVPTEPNTIATEILSPMSGQGYSSDACSP